MGFFIIIGGVLPTGVVFSYGNEGECARCAIVTVKSKSYNVSKFDNGFGRYCTSAAWSLNKIVPGEVCPCGFFCKCLKKEA